MTPERGGAPVVQTEAQEKRQPDSWERHLTLRANQRQGNALGRFRCRLARVLTGRDFFNRDASLELDRLLLENESLRQQLVQYQA